MHIKLLLFACLLCTGLQAAAQQTFNGYYINNNGDTSVVSFPSYKQWKYNPAQIDARTIGGQALVLTPENAREVTIDGYDTYRSRRFTRLLNPYSSSPNHQAQPAIDSAEEIHGFLRFIAQGGGVSLYKFMDKSRINFFIEKGESLLELHYKTHINDDAQIVEDNRFKRELWIAFDLGSTDNSALKHSLEHLIYEEEQLKAFIRQVDGRRTKKKRMYPSELNLMGGIAYNTFSVRSKDYSNINTKTEYNSGISPVLGITFYDYNQRNFGRSFFTVQLKYYSFKNTGTYSLYGQEGKITYSATVLNLGAGFGRNFIQKPALTVYASLVPTMVYLPDSKEDNNRNSEYRKEELLRYNLSLQTGLRLPGSLGLWAHYNLLPMDVHQYIAFSNRHHSFQIGVECKLKKKK